jgi:hypothetical protein
LPEFLLPCSLCEAMPIRRTTSSFRSAIWGPVAGLMQLGASNRPFRGAPSRPSQWCLFIGSPWHFGDVPGCQAKHGRNASWPPFCFCIAMPLYHF